MKSKNRKICVWYDSCPLKRFYQQGKLAKGWILNYCWNDNSKCVRKKMEENGEYHPDNMLPDGKIDEGLV